MDGTLLIKQISICPVFFLNSNSKKYKKINFNNTVFNFDVVNKDSENFTTYYFFYTSNSLSVNYNVRHDKLNLTTSIFNCITLLLSTLAFVM
jgi:hypothetical protein